MSDGELLSEADGSLRQAKNKSPERSRVVVVVARFIMVKQQNSANVWKFAEIAGRSIFVAESTQDVDEGVAVKSKRT